MPAKTAFIHFGKVAGRYINAYLNNAVFESTSTNLAVQKVKIYNSWTTPFLLGRDWNEKELMQLAANRHPHQYPTPDEVRLHHQHWSHNYLDRQYVHNHQHGWSRATVSQFRKQGWFTFMFIREPRDLLCSLWTWLQKSNFDHHLKIQPESLASKPLDDFIQEILTRPGLAGFYALPDYTDQIDYVAEFNMDNFIRFLKKYFNHTYHPQKEKKSWRFASKNPGYAVYREQGLISDRTHQLFDESIEVLRVRELINSCMKREC